MPVADRYQIHSRTPTRDEYKRLCEAVGWGTVMNFDAATEALPRSLFAVVAVADGKAVGMGRIVGDGAIFFYVQDIAVLPQWQGRGVGKAILSASHSSACSQLREPRSSTRDSALPFTRKTSECSK